MKLGLLGATWTAFNEDKAQRLAASIAYSTIFSLAPLFVVLIAIVGGILDVNGSGGHTSAQNTLLAQIRHSAGPAAADAVRQLISAAFNKPRANLIAQILGWIFFVVGASGLFASLQDALNAVWHIESVKGGWKQILRDRIASFVMIVAVGFLLLATFLANATIAFVGVHFLSSIPLATNPTVLALLNQAIDVVLITVAFALIFKVLPDVDISWRDVGIGAAVTAVFFVIGEAVIALYIAYGGVASAYGAAGSLLVALVWIYYSALILLLGAEFTKVYANRARLAAAATLRVTPEAPAGIDPRFAGKSS
jgi:membrane protein